MRSILEEFACGNIPIKVRNFTPNSMYGQAMHFTSVNEEKLLHRLSGEEKVIFQKYIDAKNEVNELAAIKNFTHGYKLGLIMAAEAFVTTDQLMAMEEYEV